MRERERRDQGSNLGKYLAESMGSLLAGEEMGNRLGVSRRAGTRDCWREK